MALALSAQELTAQAHDARGALCGGALPGAQGFRAPARGGPGSGEFVVGER